MGEERSRWQPLSREQFNRLRRGQRLRDHRGRAWTVTPEAVQEHGLAQLVIRSGDLVRQVEERFADDYMLPEAEIDTGPAGPPTDE